MIILLFVPIIFIITSTVYLIGLLIESIKQDFIKQNSLLQFIVVKHTISNSTEGHLYGLSKEQGIIPQKASFVLYNQEQIAKQTFAIPLKEEVLICDSIVAIVKSVNETNVSHNTNWYNEKPTSFLKAKGIQSEVSNAY